MTLTVAEVAALSGVQPGTIRVHLRSGRLPGKKLGRDWLIQEHHARDWASTYSPYDTLRKGAER